MNPVIKFLLSFRLAAMAFNHRILLSDSLKELKKEKIKSRCFFTSGVAGLRLKEHSLGHESWLGQDSVLGLAP